MNTRLIVLAIASLALLPASLPAQKDKEPDRGAKETDRKTADELLHTELRAFKDSLVKAVKEGDLPGQLEHVTPNVVVTWQNGQVVKGKDELKKFYEENAAKSQVFQGYVKEPEPTDLTVLYGGDAGISYGTSVGKYKVMGMSFELKNHWTATLTKEDGKWRIASYHVSNNVLDNPLLTTLYWALGGALVIGLLLGFLIGRMTGRRAA